MEIRAQAAMLLTLVEADGSESVRASVLEGTNESLNETARDMAGVLVSVANNPEPPFDPDPQLAAKDARIAALEAEVEDARIYITTEDGAKLHIRNLIRCGLRSLKKKRGVFWSNVADAFGVGSTSAHRLCRFVNLDPDTGELVDPQVFKEAPQ